LGFAYCAAYTACLARIVLGFFNNADAFEPGLVRDHLDDLIEWPFVELLVPAVSPVFAISDVRKVSTMIVETPRASASLTRDLVKTVEQVNTLTSTLLVQGTRFIGSAPGGL